MCIIIVAPPSATVNDETIILAIENNPHGWGMTAKHPDTREIFVKRGFDARLAVKGWNEFAGMERVFHARISTGGGIDQGNLHPFGCNSPTGERRFFFHNGTVNSIPEFNEKYCDTWHLAQYIKGFRTSKNLDEKLAVLAGRECSRFVMVRPDTTMMYGRGWYGCEGASYSNTGCFKTYDYEGEGDKRKISFKFSSVKDYPLEITSKESGYGLNYDNERKLYSNKAPDDKSYTPPTVWTHGGRKQYTGEYENYSDYAETEEGILVQRNRLKELTGEKKEGDKWDEPWFKDLEVLSGTPGFRVTKASYKVKFKDSDVQHEFVGIYNSMAEWIFGLPRALKGFLEVNRYLRMRYLGYDDAEAREGLGWPLRAYPDLDMLQTGRAITVAAEEMKAALERRKGLGIIDDAIVKAKEAADKIKRQEDAIKAEKKEDEQLEAAKDFLRDTLESPEMSALEIRFPAMKPPGTFMLMTIKEFMELMDSRRQSMVEEGVSIDDIEESIYQSYMLLAKYNENIFADTDKLATAEELSVLMDC